MKLYEKINWWAVGFFVLIFALGVLCGYLLFGCGDGSNPVSVDPPGQVLGGLTDSTDKIGSVLADLERDSDRERAIIDRMAGLSDREATAIVGLEDSLLDLADGHSRARGLVTELRDLLSGPSP